MFSNNQFKNNVICYHGPINIDLISILSNYLKQFISTEAVTMGRIYKVFIELAQNVSYYSAEQHDEKRSFGAGIGWFRIDEDEEYFAIQTGNRIYKEHGAILIKNSKEINSLNEKDLRELKRKTRSKAGKLDIGAHIGLIQTGLITGNLLETNVEPINEKHSYFTITAKVNKHNKIK
jgi:hypothetical protein